MVDESKFGSSIAQNGATAHISALLTDPGVPAGGVRRRSPRWAVPTWSVLS